MNGLLEILSAKKWMISPDFLHGIRSALENNLNGHLAFDAPHRGDMLRVFGYNGEQGFSEVCVDPETGRSMGSSFDAVSIADRSFVSVLSVDGPITRNGGGCSMGSIDLRDAMMAAAQSEFCVGHIFVINTPGGSAWAKNDFQQAINFAHEKNQPVVAFVDGVCESAGMYLAALCDERYYMNPKNEIGCIGVMAAFYTEKDGSKNEYTNETYHEIYDPESFDKNKQMRDIANDGDDALLIKELADLGEEFRADVLAACPNATDEHLHGKEFYAEEVDGILMDGQSDLGSLLVHVYNMYQSQYVQKKQNKGKQVPASSMQGAQASGALALTQGNNDSNTNTYINMANYPLLQQALGIKELAVEAEGTFMNAPLLDVLEAHLAEQEQKLQTIADLQKEVDEAKASVQEASENIDALNAKYEEAEKALAVKDALLAKAEEDQKNALAQKDEEMANLNAEHEKALAEKDEALKASAEELDKAKATLATAEQTIADKDAQIQALTEKPQDAPDIQSPDTNGASAEEPKFVCGAPKYNPNLSPAENARIFNEYKQGLLK